MESKSIKDIKFINNKTFLFFSTNWCPQCSFMKGLVENIAKKFKDVNFFYIDAENEKLLRSNKEWNVLKVPSFYLINEKLQKLFVGFEIIEQEIIIAAIKDFFNY